MKKILFTLLLPLFFLAEAQAQRTTAFGIKAGVNVATIDGKDIDDTELVLGYHVGLLLNTPIALGVHLQPELLFSLKGTGDTGTDDNLTTMYAELPVMARVMLGEKFSIHFGPYVGFMINSKKGNDNVNDLLNGFDAGVGLGLGYNLSNRLFVDARYQYGLLDVYKENKAAGIPAIEGGNRVVQLSLGYLIGGNR